MFTLQSKFSNCFMQANVSLAVVKVRRGYSRKAHSMGCSVRSFTLSLLLRMHTKANEVCIKHTRSSLSHLTLLFFTTSSACGLRLQLSDLSDPSVSFGLSRISAGLLPPSFCNMPVRDPPTLPVYHLHVLWKIYKACKTAFP